MTSFKTIKIKRYEDIVNERPAEGTILPGHLLTLTSTSGFVPNVTAAEADRVPMIFALEDELQGKTIRDEYSTNDRVTAWYVQPGEEVLAIIDGAATPAVGDLLETGAGGVLQAVSTGAPIAQVVGDHFDDGSGNRRVAVRPI